MSNLSSSLELSTQCGAVLALLLCTSGCVLAESASDFPFRPVLTFDDRDTGPLDDMPLADVPIPDPPLLIFTEVLIDSPGSDPGLTERGEYVEIKNIGKGPADPRAITMFLRDLDNPLGGARIRVQDGFGDEEKAIVNGLQAIQPGEYFVFVRYEDPSVAAITAGLAPGYSYDFGRYASGPTLPHQQGVRRQLDLGYSFADGETAIFDGIRWEGHELLDPVGDGAARSFFEGEAIAVDQAFEGPDANNDPQRWCIPDEEVGAVNGTPGGATSCG